MTLSKDQKMKIGCIIVMLLLIPAVIVYYEYNVAAANNIQQMREHAQAALNQTLPGVNVGNLSKIIPGNP